MRKIIVALALIAGAWGCSTSQKATPTKTTTSTRVNAVITERNTATSPESASETIAVPQSGGIDVKTQPRAVAEAEKVRKAEGN